MFPEFVEGTFIWHWAHSWAGLHGMILGLLSGFLAVFLTKQTTINTLVKALITAGVVATLPLGLSKLGINILVYDGVIGLSDQMTAYLSLLGSALAVGIAVPYLFYETLREPLATMATHLGNTFQTSRREDDSQTVEFSGAAWNKNTLTFQAGSNAGETMNIGEGTFTVGRSADNDLVVDDPTVSRYHARITVDNGSYNIEDLNSASGTKVNGHKVTTGSVQPGSTIRLGNTEVVLNGRSRHQDRFPSEGASAISDMGETKMVGSDSSSNAWLAVTEGPGEGRTFNLNNATTTIGRDATNDFPIDDPYMSRHQAVFRLEGGRIRLFDLASNSGTKVNGNDIGGRGIESGNSVKVGETVLSLIMVNDPRQFAQATMSGNTMIDHTGEQAGVLVVKSGVDAGKTFALSQGDNLIGRTQGVP
jgi:pSer/pThr/pTyr-binding forkhead associated (FHA) protein